MQAIILAAGGGRRLKEYTKDNTKCMVSVNGKKLIDRALFSLAQAGIEKVVVVVGYKAKNLKDYLQTNYKSQFKFKFIFNKDYATTNNIYSLFLTKKLFTKEDTILLESDLIFEPELVKNLCQVKHENVAVVAKFKPFMDGTVVTRDDAGFVTDFIGKNKMEADRLDEYFKTVNIYKFSKEFVKNTYFPFLETYMKVFGMNSYYETVLKIIPSFVDNCIYGYDLGGLKWYEIDNPTDLNQASLMFKNNGGKSGRKRTTTDG